MKYSKSTLNSDWHALRQTEPADYDILEAYKNREKQAPNLHSATYKRMRVCFVTFSITRQKNFTHKRTLVCLSALILIDYR